MHTHYYFTLHAFDKGLKKRYEHKKPCNVIGRLKMFFYVKLCNTVQILVLLLGNAIVS